MQKSIKVETSTTPPTDNTFFNIFYPVVPYLLRIGIAAQIVSAITEAVTVYLIVQSNLSGQNKVLAFLASIVAGLLIVYILEIGGRKFVQVLTRVTVWKKFNNLWYVSLFTFVSIVTIGIFYLSINLSTRGVNYAFTASTMKKQQYNATADKNQLRAEIKTITDQFDKERQTIEKSYLEQKDAITTLFDAKVQEQESKVSAFEKKDKAGERWAKSHANKWKAKVSATRTAKSKELSTITANYTATLKDWQNRSNEATQAATDQNTAAIQAATATHENNQETTRNTANFWGNLFSTLVGSCIVLAFGCIIIVEVFNRGSGMKLEHKQIEREPSLLFLFFAGIKNRFSGRVRKRLQSFAQATTPPANYQKIGFSVSNRSKDSFDTKVTSISKVSNLSSGDDSGTIHAISPIPTGDDSRAYDHRMGRSTAAGTIPPQDAPGTPKTIIKTVVIEKEKLSRCEYCQSEYQRNSRKQKFCSTSCRKANWKKENGRDPFLKKGK